MKIERYIGTKELLFLFIAIFFLPINSIAQPSISSLVKKVQPAVVSITVYDAQGNASGQGSGFFISQKGEVITNWHVIGDASAAIVKTATGAMFEVKGIVAKDEKRDLAKIVLDTKNVIFPNLNLSPANPKVGERIFVVGSPFGLESTVSDGLVSAIRNVPDVGNIFQISAPISPGSSGSPVLNLDGQVVGVASFQFIKGQNLNFAISATYIAKLPSVNQVSIIPLGKDNEYLDKINPEVQLQDNGWIRIDDTYVEELTAEEFYKEFLSEYDKGKIIKKLHVKVQFLKPCKAVSKNEDIECMTGLVIYYSAMKSGASEEDLKTVQQEIFKRCPDIMEYMTPRFSCDYRFKVFFTSFSRTKFKEYESFTTSFFPAAPIIDVTEDKISRKNEMLPGETMWIEFVIPDDATSWHVWVPK